MDSLNKTKEQSQPIINSKMSTRPNPCVTSEEKTPGEIVMSQTVSFSDVVYGFVQEDYSEFTDFPSSEDLDAFLAIWSSIGKLYCRKHRWRLPML